MTTAFYVSFLVLWVVTIVLFLLVLGLVRSVYDLRRQVGVAVGEPRRAPHFQAPTLDGQVIDTRDIDETPYALLFVTPDCPSCRQAVSSLGPVRKRVGSNIVILCNGRPEDAARLARIVESECPLRVGRGRRGRQGVRDHVLTDDGRRRRGGADPQFRRADDQRSAGAGTRRCGRNRFRQERCLRGDWRSPVTAGASPGAAEADEVYRRIRLVAILVATLALAVALAALFVAPGFTLLGVSIALGSTQLAGY